MVTEPLQVCSEPSDWKPGTRSSVGAAAKTTGVSQRYVWMAKAVQRDAVPEVVALAFSGAISLYGADAVRRLDHDQQRDIARRVVTGELRTREVHAEAERLRNEPPTSLVLYGLALKLVRLAGSVVDAYALIDDVAAFLEMDGGE